MSFFACRLLRVASAGVAVVFGASSYWLPAIKMTLGIVTSLISSCSLKPDSGKGKSVCPVSTPAILKRFSLTLTRQCSLRVSCFLSHTIITSKSLIGQTHSFHKNSYRFPQYQILINARTLGTRFPERAIEIRCCRWVGIQCNWTST